MSWKCFSFATALLVTTLWAFAADENASAEADRTAVFKQIDANGDGLISEDEVPEDKRQLLTRLLRRGSRAFSCSQVAAGQAPAAHASAAPG